MRPYAILTAGVLLSIALVLASQALADEVDDYLEAQRAKHHIPGVALLVVKEGETVKCQGYGLANVEHQTPVTPDTVFQLGSIGKQFTATGIMLLAEDGKLSVDDPIRKFLPDAPDSWQPTTLKQLLSHTAGLGDWPKSCDLRRDYTEAELLAVIYAEPRKFTPGTDWSYSNLGYVILGIVIERITGKHYGELLAERVFKPAGMAATRIISDADIVPHRAAGYRLLKGELKNQDFVSPTLNSTADGSVYTNLRDMVQWNAAILSGKILRPESLTAMWTPSPLTSGVPNSAGYGYGWFCGEHAGRRCLSHGGAWQGFTANLVVLPEDQLTTLMLTNLSAGSFEGLGEMNRHVAGMFLSASERASKPDRQSSRPSAGQ